MTRFPLAAAMCCLFLAACSGDQGPAGPSLSGSWEGIVYLHDEYGAPLASDSGVTVTAMPGSITNVTTHAGQYRIGPLKTGVYTLQFAGSGYGTSIRDAAQFVGGGTVDIAPLNLSQQSAGVVTGLALTPNVAGDTITVTGTINAPPPGLGRYVRLFYGTTTGVGAGVAAYNVTGPVSGTAYHVTHTTFTIAITGADLQALRNEFATTSTVYAVAYGDSFYNNSYADTTTSKTVYPNVSATPSNVVSFTMP